MELITLFHDALVHWWLTTGILRRLGDLVVAALACGGFYVGWIIWKARDTVSGSILARIFAPSFDADKASKEIVAFHASISGLGATACYILEIEQAQNRRIGLLAWAAIPDEKSTIEGIARDTPDSTLIAIGNSDGYDLATFEAIILAFPHWLQDGNLLIAIPNVPRARKRAVLVVHVSPNATTNQRARIETKAVMFATRHSGGR